MPDTPSEVTLLLRRAKAGDPDAQPELFRVVRQKLHDMARKKLAQEQDGISIQATELVNDAYLQLVDSNDNADLADRKHFYILAAKVMRRILIDRARARRALKRGGPHWKRSTVAMETVPSATSQIDVLALHDALKSLAKIDQRQADIVEMRYFGGYTVEETADLLDVSASTVKQEFAAAKAWLYRELTRSY